MPPKPMQKTEQVWRKRGVNVRSAMWNDPRGGAAFAVATLTLLAKVRRAAWPWSSGAVHRQRPEGVRLAVGQVGNRMVCSGPKVI